MAEPEIEVAYAALAAIEAELAESRGNVGTASVRLRRLRRERAVTARLADPRDSEAAEALARLDAAIATAIGELAALRTAQDEIRARRTQAVVALGEVADPRRRIGALEGNTPLLMLPMRLETRFRDGELWVRIYPDQWAVDTFEERLSESSSSRRNGSGASGGARAATWTAVGQLGAG